MFDTDNTDNMIPSEEFTYKIIGFSYQVYNQLGYGLQEKYYQRALSQLLEEHNIKYEREVYIPVKFKEVNIGKYFIDFKIDDNLIVELKVCNQFYQNHINQVLAYLKTYNIKLGLLILFTRTGIKIKRLIV